MRCYAFKRRIRAALLAALPILLLPAYEAACAAADSYPLLAIDPLPGLAEVETRSDALRRWASRGFTKAVLLNIDTRDGLRPLGTTATTALAGIDRMRAAPQSVNDDAEGPGKRAQFENGLVRAAISLGIVREVYWIVPLDPFPTPDPDGFLRAYLKAAGLVEDDLRTFAMRDDCYRGAAAGIPFAVCGPGGLPRIDEPLLLSVSPDFLLTAAAAVNANPLGEIKKLVSALAGKKYSVIDAVLIASVESGRKSHTVPDLRWIGEAFAQSLRDPTLLTGAMPKRWSTLQKLAALEAAGDFRNMLHEALPYLTVHDEDPALQIYAAEALTGLGRPQEALGRAVLACKLHPGYCSGLPWIGLGLFAAGDFEGAERFFAAGAALRPQMVFGQFARGLWLQNAGRRAEALAVFQNLSDRGEAFPAAFLAGALHLGDGDRVSARQQFDRGLQTLQDEPPDLVNYPDIAEAIKAAATFYRQEALTRQAELLEGDSRLRPLVLETPPGPP